MARAGGSIAGDDYVSKSVAADILLYVSARCCAARVDIRDTGSPRRHFQRARLLAIDDSPTYLESWRSLCAEDMR